MSILDDLIAEGDALFVGLPDDPADWSGLQEWTEKVEDELAPDERAIFLAATPPPAPLIGGESYTGARRVLWTRLNTLHRIAGR